MAISIISPRFGQATDLPILRKDFIVDRYQILEARAAGADAILLIVAALDAAGAQETASGGHQAGLDVLVEIHDLFELPIALDAGASIVGVNNRNLRTLGGRYRRQPAGYRADSRRRDRRG